MIGQTISHYKILEKLGEGGMGVVYKAEDTRLKRTVALKFLPSELTFDADARERFIREAQAASALDHPNICSVYDFGETNDGKSYITMAYYGGETLKQKLKRGPIPPEKAVAIAFQIAQGLSRAHEAGIVHRDVKPANIMVTVRGEVKILDFGLSRFGAQQRLTKSGTTLGTAAYMSPEQANGEPVDYRADVWSLGVVLYEMLSADLPFRGEHEPAMLYSIVHENPKPLPETVPAGLRAIVSRALNKDPEARYSSAQPMLDDLEALRSSVKGASSVSRGSVLHGLRKEKVLIPSGFILLAVLLGLAYLIARQGRITRAREVLLPQIDSLVHDTRAGYDNLVDAYRLALEAEEYIAGDPRLEKLLVQCSGRISVQSDPPGARVYVKQYSLPEDPWQLLGVSPLESLRVPLGVFRWKIDKDGYETVLAVSPTYKAVLGQNNPVPINFHRTLDAKGSIPPGMTRVAGGDVPGVGHLDDFYIDKFEVTNRQFKEFIDSGGYEKPQYWTEPFANEGEGVSWQAAVAGFTDQTGRPGPSVWQGGTYPDGQDNYPVSGISWYEALACARFYNKTLPTKYHWDLARERNLMESTNALITTLLFRMSNYNSRGPAPCGSFQGMTPFGASDMAGNVREWCWNEMPQGRLVKGGAWSDTVYMYQNNSQAAPFDRSATNGFRCAVYRDAGAIPLEVFRRVLPPSIGEKPQVRTVSPEVFAVYMNQFSYKRMDLRPQVEHRDSSVQAWLQEKVTFDAAYADDRVIAYLFLPRNARPPFQTVIFFPGSSAQLELTSEHMEEQRLFVSSLSFIVKDGRAVVFPVYEGTFERQRLKGASKETETEYRIHLVKDLRRTLDYLWTRQEIDTQKIAYLGMSWGGNLAPIMLAVEDRLKLGIVKNGGLHVYANPESDPASYVTRVTVPVLMLAGRYDLVFPLETTVKPFFSTLGTPEADKLLKVYDTDHFISPNENIKETLAWLDKYFGRPLK